MIDIEDNVPRLGKSRRVSTHPVAGTDNTAACVEHENGRTRIVSCRRLIHIKEQFLAVRLAVEDSLLDLNVGRCRSVLREAGDCCDEYPYKDRNGQVNTFHNHVSTKALVLSDILAQLKLF